MPNSFKNPLALKKKLPARLERPVSGSRIKRLWLAFKKRWSWKVFGLSVGGLFLLLLIASSAVFAYFVRDLPNPQAVQEKQLAQSTQILARDGTPLYNIHGEQNRQLVTGDQISPFVKQAAVSVEDASFYKDYGFSFKGLARALIAHIPLVKRLLPSGELAGGGSTITQQYIKNAENWNSDATISRKLKELILAVEVERKYSKDQILTDYLNIIPYGSNAYGIEAASQTYFGIDASMLTLSQSATLAAIPQQPTTYSPYGNHTDQLFARKDYILNRMVDTGYITQAQADAAKSAAPSISNPAFKQQSDLIAPHFVFYVRQQLIDFIGGDQETAEQKLDQAGYKVTTSLDLSTQNLAQQTISTLAPAALKKYNASNACLTSVDPRTGEVLAMVGSVDYSGANSGNTNFCTAQLQPGSTFKPFIYATQFSPGHTQAPSSITYDLVTNFSTSATGYSPTDYNGSCEYCGPVTDRNALDGSLNIPAVKNFYLAGIKQSIQTAQKLGISTLTKDPNYYGLPLVLGSGSVEPVEMANAYASFANGGQHFALRPILKIEKAGVIIKDYTKDAPTKVLEPETAYEISSILSDNASRTKIFGAHSALTLGPDRPVAAKSGTTQNNRDAWTIGFTPSIVTAVWVGNNLPGKTMVAGSDGSFVAAPIWNSFMKQYLTGKPVEQFTAPSTMKTMTVDMLSGKLPTSQTPSSDLVTDIFAPWQVPTTNDDVHITVAIDSVSGKLATSLTPASDIVQKTYFNVHSEEPSLPNWEGPVQAWANANGGDTSPPTDTDNVHTEANAPTVQISSPSDGSSVSGTFTISANPGGVNPITSVEFFLNGVSIGSATSSPWSVTYQASQLSQGSQIIKAVATNSLGLTASDQVTITPAGTDVSAPDKISDLSGTAVIGQHTIRLSWTNPSNADLAKVNLYISTKDNPTGNNNATPISISASPNSQGSYNFNTDGNAGTTYYILVRPVDTSGNENQSPTADISIHALP